MPARTSSLFLMDFPSASARSFSASSIRYSSFGIMKLSRTNLIFLGLSNFLEAGLAAAEAGLTVLSAGLATGMGFLLLDVTRLTGVLKMRGATCLATVGLATGAVALLMSGCATESVVWVLGVFVLIESSNQ